MLLSNVEGRENAATVRPAAGNPGHADPEIDRAQARARLGHCSAHPAGIERRAADRAGLALSGAASAGVQGVDSGAMGRLGEQPAGTVLLADSGRPKATGCGAGELGAPGRGGESGAGTDISLRAASEGFDVQ